MASRMHITSTHAQRSELQSVIDGSLDMLPNNFATSFEQHDQASLLNQIDVHQTVGTLGKEINLEAHRINAATASYTCPFSSTSSEKPSVRLFRKSRKYSRVPDNGILTNKKDKYRERNRIAAAKCRVKKKEHADLLEHTYRTQSAINTALRQIEKSLRDELCLWRTQALQHTFCDCYSIQNYNLRKAQSVAFETIPTMMLGK